MEVCQEERGRTRWVCAAGSTLRVIVAIISHVSSGTSALPVGEVIRLQCVGTQTSQDKVDKIQVTDGLLHQWLTVLVMFNTTG